MLTTGLVLATLVLGAHGELPREEKFVGTLVAQASGDFRSINAQALQQEIAELERTRPSLTPGTVVLSIGGGVTLLGILVVISGVAAGGFGGLGIAALGLIVGAAGLVVLVVGTIIMIVAGVERGRVNSKIDALKAQLLALPPPPPALPPPPPPGVFNDVESTLLLARF